MQAEFTYLTESSLSGPARLTQPSAVAAGAAGEWLAALENAGFNRIVTGNDPFSDLDFWAQAARATSAIDVAAVHNAGVVDPVAAARSLAGLDALSGGRLSIRVLSAPSGLAADGGRLTHVEAVHRTDEYLVLLKRLWSNEGPFDHEGPNYSLRNAYVARKGPRGAGIPVRINGLSGTVFRLAGRHADVFELPWADVVQVRHIVERVRAAAAETGRASKISFALPVRLDSYGRAANEPAGESGLEAAVRAGSPERIALALLPYAALGVSEFMVSGLETLDEVAAAGRDLVPLVRNTVSRWARAQGSAAHPEPAAGLRAAPVLEFSRH